MPSEANVPREIIDKAKSRVKQDPQLDLQEEVEELAYDYVDATPDTEYTGLDLVEKCLALLHSM